jgi:hypothetical protein
MKTLRHDSRSPGRNLNPVPTDYETGVPTTGPRRSMSIYLDAETVKKTF